MRQAVIGLLAHVDAGKTTLAEAMLYRAGAIRVKGRVDHGDSHLDIDAQERARGITIFSKQASLDYGGVHVMLLDAPGHVDFSAEAERTLQALDYAVLVVGANDGVQGHTETLWELLGRYGVPVLVFVNKMDLAGTDRDGTLRELQRRLSGACVDGEALLGGDEGALEDAASTDEDALDEYLSTGGLSVSTLQRLVTGRRVHPVFFGSALKGDGVEGLLDGIARIVDDKAWPDEFAARVYKVSRSSRGERLAWLKVTGGVLKAKMLVEGVDHGEAWADKIDQVRLYQAGSFETVSEVPAGRVCAVTGLAHVLPGSALGAEPAGEEPMLVPVLSYQVMTGDADVHAVVRALDRKSVV